MSNPKSAEKTRLNKIIAEAGLASRRGADQLIEEGHVTVNGKKVYELGIKVDPNQDTILVDGKPLRRITHKIYLVFHKPKGVLTTMEDPLDRPNVSHYLDKVPYRVFPVGRLDWDSEGLLLLTNDGEFANKVTHPKAEVTKTYLVKVNGQPKPEQLEKLKRGVSIIGGKVAAKHIEKIKRKDASDQYDWFKMIITEGKNRQIRQMFEKIGFDVLKLQRVAIGRLRLGNLDRGELAYMDENSLDRIFEPDLPEELEKKRSYKGRVPSQKRLAREGADKGPRKSDREDRRRPSKTSYSKSGNSKSGFSKSSNSRKTDSRSGGPKSGGSRPTRPGGRPGKRPQSSR